MRSVKSLFRRLTSATLAAAFAVTVAAVLALATPASASTTISSCPPGAASGTASLSPPISHNNSNTVPSTITSSTSATGCTGKNVLGGTISSTLTSLNPTTGCSRHRRLARSSPEVASARRGNGQTSTGTAKIKSTGPGTPLQFKVIEKVTAGFGFLAGHITKITGTVQFAGTVGNCVASDISMVRAVNATTFNFVQN